MTSDDDTRLWKLDSTHLHGFAIPNSSTSSPQYIFHDIKSCNIDVSQTLESHKWQYYLRITLSPYSNSTVTSPYHSQEGTLLLLPLSQILNISIFNYGVLGQQLRFRIAKVHRGQEPLRQKLSSQGFCDNYAPNEDDPYHLLGMLKYGSLTIDTATDSTNGPNPQIHQVILDWVQCLKRNAWKGWNNQIDVIVEDDRGRCGFLEDEGDALSDVKVEMSEVAETDLEIPRAVSLEGSDETAGEDEPSRGVPMQKELKEDVTSKKRSPRLDDEVEEFVIDVGTPIANDAFAIQPVVSFPRVPASALVPNLNAKVNSSSTEPDLKKSLTAQQPIKKSENNRQPRSEELRVPFKRQRRSHSQQNGRAHHYLSGANALPLPNRRPPPFIEHNHPYNPHPDEYPPPTRPHPDDRQRSFYSGQGQVSPPIPSPRMKYTPRRASTDFHVRPPRIRHVNTNSSSPPRRDMNWGSSWRPRDETPVHHHDHPDRGRRRNLEIVRMD